MAPFRSAVLTLPSSKKTSTVPFSTSAFEYSTPEILFSSHSTAVLQWPQCMFGTLNVFSVIITPFFWMTHSLNSQEPLHGGGEFFYLLVSLLAVLHGPPHAVLDVVLEHYRANLLQGRDDAGDLGEDIYAVGLLIHHPLHAPHLTLDPPEAVLELFFILGLYVTVGGSLRGGCPATVCRGPPISPFSIPSPGAAAERCSPPSRWRAP